MKLNFSLKKIVPLLALFALVVGFMNMGSYDPYNEMSVFSPNHATATWWGNNDDCEIWTADQELYVGSDAIIEWWVEDGYNDITINGESVTGTSKTYHDLQNNTTFKLVAKNDEGKSCTAKVKVECLPAPPPECTLSPEYKEVFVGEEVTLNWTTTNASKVTLTGFGEVEQDGSVSTGPLTENAWYELVAENDNGVTVSCYSDIEVKAEPVAPVCEAFSATPTVITSGQSTELSWSTSNGNRVVIDNGVGEVGANDSISVSPLETTIYTLTVFGDDHQEDTCVVEVAVEEEVVPQCLTFTADPATLPFGGGTTTLKWTTDNATSVSIDQGVGEVEQNGSQEVTLDTTTTYTLTAGDGTNHNSCEATVVVEDPVPASITCEANVDLSISPSTIERGESSTLVWSTDGITGVSFNNNIAATGLSGSVSVSPDVSTSYTLTATDGTDTIECPITLSVTAPPSGGGGGGGGGGSSSPRCELSVSDSKIERGEEITLTWESSRAGEVIIVDSEGETIITTEDLLSRDKEEFYDGEIELSPTKDVTYTMTVERGSKDRVCEADVRVVGGSNDDDDEIVVTEVRDQRPLVSGISLTEVPYTGFEAGPVLSAIFYILLVLWALYVAYLFVIHRGMVDGFRFSADVKSGPRSGFAPSKMIDHQPKTTTEISASVVTPSNLPTAKGDTEEVVNDAVITKIENQAHAEHVLLSSDAVHHFVATTDAEERESVMKKVIEIAKGRYPAEDGWVVINEARMREACEACSPSNAGSSNEPFIPNAVPKGAGSLAEAIVLGNIVASYEMVGDRPMFALADAAADLDSVYRVRKGGDDEVSELLMKETEKFSDEQIHAIIHALTGALDGTYNDETEAVRMAIMKAVKVVTHS